MEFSAQQIATFLNGQVVGDKDIKVNNFSKIEEGRKGTISFLSNPKYTQYIYTTDSDIVLVNKDFVPEKSVKCTLIQVDNAYEAVGKLLNLSENSKPSKTGISPKADISTSATLGKDVFVGSFVTIGQGCKIGNNVKIHPNTQVGDNVTIGDNSIVYANVSIYDNCIIGENNIIHSGAVIGADGFGFAPDKEGHYNKIPQIGNVVLGNNVEIGANATIDRATMGSTIIEEGVKIDNLVQIAHNVKIGKDTAMAAQCGVAGSTVIGKNCILAGQVGIAGHLRIADKTIFGAQTGVSSNIKEPGKIWQGTPVIPISNFQRSSIGLRKLPELMNTIYNLEKEIAELKKSIKE